MKNPNGPSREEIGEWNDALADEERALLVSSGACFTAILTCTEMAVRLDLRARLATEQQHKDGTWGNWRHDAEIMRMAARVLGREAQTNPTPAP